MKPSKNPTETPQKHMEGMTCFSVELTMGRSPLSDQSHHLILESNPTPDYYAKGNFPPNREQSGYHHLFLPIKKSIPCFQDEVYRKACRLLSKFGEGVNIYPGQMTFQNESHPCIRVNLSGTHNVPEILDEFSKMDLHFYPSKSVETYTSFVYYKRYTGFTELEEGVYQDDTTPGRYFFRIEGNIDFKQFQKGIQKIKNNCNYHLFDSFLASLFYRNTVIDFIGIYSEHCDNSRLSEFKKEIQQLFNQ